MYWYITVINDLLNFRGRARRKEYWMFTLINVLFFIMAMVIDNYVIEITIKGDIPAGYATFIYYFFVLIPSLAVSVRRLHDIGKSGWFYFVGFIPLVGGPILIYLMCIDSQPGTNKWGENPKID